MALILVCFENCRLELRFALQSLNRCHDDPIETIFLPQMDRLWSISLFRYSMDISVTTQCTDFSIHLA